MEDTINEDIVIVGAGIAGLTTSLGLHRLGIRSLVLESSDKLRTAGFAIMAWTNAWKALDAIGIGDSLRQNHQQLLGVQATSIETGDTSEFLFNQSKLSEGHEIRGVKGKLLLGTLEKELPSSTIRYNSKVVNIEDSGYSKLIHLVDGTTIKAKVLIGCDGVNSVVAKSLGLKNPAFLGRSAMRGYADYKDGHKFEPKFLEYFGKGVKYGFIPCDDHTMYWFLTYIPSHRQDIGMEEDPMKMKKFLLSTLGDASEEVKGVLENTNPESILSSPLRYRYLWELIWGNISKGNVCVAGDALHRMTLDLGQGGCSALEDGVVLARCLGQVFKQKANEEEEEYKRIGMGLEKYANERKWRGFKLISTAYFIGFIQQNDTKLVKFLRDKFLNGFLTALLFKRASFDCGKLQ